MLVVGAEVGDPLSFPHRAESSLVETRSGSGPRRLNSRQMLKFLSLTPRALGQSANVPESCGAHQVWSQGLSRGNSSTIFCFSSPKLLHLLPPVRGNEQSIQYPAKQHGLFSISKPLPLVLLMGGSQNNYLNEPGAKTP